jgi:hypothetical protein
VITGLCEYVHDHRTSQNILISNAALDIYDETLSNTQLVKLENMLATVITTVDVTFTVLVTLLLVGRIIVLRRRYIRLMGMYISESMSIGGDASITGGSDI